MQKELSYAWASDEPPTARDSAAELDKLESCCTRTQRVNRDQAFRKAKRYIAKKEGEGVDAPVFITFQNQPPPKSATNARVDIEVIAGRAFI